MVDTSSIGAFINQHQCGGGNTLYTYCCWLNLARLATPFVSNTTSHVWPLFGLQVFLECIWAAWEGFGGWHALSLMVLCHDLLRGDNKPMHQGNETHSPEMSRIPVPPKKKRKRSLLSRKRCSVSQVSPKCVKSSQGIQNSILVTRLCLGFWSWKSPADQLLGGAVHKT